MVDADEELKKVVNIFGRTPGKFFPQAREQEPAKTHGSTVEQEVGESTSRVLSDSPSNCRSSGSSNLVDASSLLARTVANFSTSRRDHDPPKDVDYRQETSYAFSQSRDRFSMSVSFDPDDYQGDLSLLPTMSSFDPFQTINEDDDAESDGTAGTEIFDPLQTIHGDDEFDYDKFTNDDARISSTRNIEHQYPSSEYEFPTSSDATRSPVQTVENFQTGPKLGVEKTASLETPSKVATAGAGRPHASSKIGTSHLDHKEDARWNMLLRLPVKRRLINHSRFWKSVVVRIVPAGGVHVIKAYSDTGESECLLEMTLQPAYTVVDEGLQPVDQVEKCHAVSIQRVSYDEAISVKSHRPPFPTLSDLRISNFQQLKNLVHKVPRVTMVLEHASRYTELLKFGGMDYAETRRFMRALEEALFRLKCAAPSMQHQQPTTYYNKEEITIEIIDQYYADVNCRGRIVSHEATVRIFCLAFLCESPLVEIGINDVRRRGREIVGRRDIIPLVVDEWIRIDSPELHSAVCRREFKTTKLVRLHPLDGCRFELMRYSVRPYVDRDLPLQIRAQLTIADRHVRIRSDLVVPAYFTAGERISQTPCRDIQIRFPLPDAWIYMFRMERLFKYGSSSGMTTTSGSRIPGLERLPLFAQGILQPSLIEVSTGSARYEDAFKAVVWRIDLLPERNEDVYKPHLLVLTIDLGPQDVVPEDMDKNIYVEYSVPNSSVSRTQVRSLAFSNYSSDEPPDRLIQHLAKYEYRVEMMIVDGANKRHLLREPQDASAGFFQTDDSSPDDESKFDTSSDDTSNPSSSDY